MEKWSNASSNFVLRLKGGVDQAEAESLSRQRMSCLTWWGRLWHLFRLWSIALRRNRGWPPCGSKMNQLMVQGLKIYGTGLPRVSKALASWNLPPRVLSGKPLKRWGNARLLTGRRHHHHHHLFQPPATASTTVTAGLGSDTFTVHPRGRTLTGGRTPPPPLCQRISHGGKGSYSFHSTLWSQQWKHPKEMPRLRPKSPLIVTQENKVGDSHPGGTTMEQIQLYREKLNQMGDAMTPKKTELTKVQGWHGCCMRGDHNIGEAGGKPKVHSSGGWRHVVTWATLPMAMPVDWGTPSGGIRDPGLGPGGTTGVYSLPWKKTPLRGELLKWHHGVTACQGPVGWLHVKLKGNLHLHQHQALAGRPQERKTHQPLTQSDHPSTTAMAMPHPNWVLKGD